MIISPSCSETCATFEIGLTRLVASVAAARDLVLVVRLRELAFFTFFFVVVPRRGFFLLLFGGAADSAFVASEAAEASDVALAFELVFFLRVPRLPEVVFFRVVLAFFVVFALAGKGFPFDWRGPCPGPSELLVPLDVAPPEAVVVRLGRESEFRKHLGRPRAALVLNPQAHPHPRAVQFDLVEVRSNVDLLRRLPRAVVALHHDARSRHHRR